MSSIFLILIVVIVASSSTLYLLLHQHQQHHPSLLLSSSESNRKVNVVVESVDIKDDEVDRTMTFFWQYGLYQQDGRFDTAGEQSSKDGMKITSELLLLHEKEFQCIGEWMKMYPDYHHRLYDRESGLLFISAYYPEYLDLYTKLEKPVMQSDVLRYLLLHHHRRSIHSDIDACPNTAVDHFRSLDALITSSSSHVIFFTETVLTAADAIANGYANPIRNNRPELRQRIANYFIIAIQPRHIIFLQILTEIISRHQQQQHQHRSSLLSHYDVLYLTGPDVVTECIYRFCGWSDVHEGKEEEEEVTVVRAQPQEQEQQQCDNNNNDLAVVPWPEDQSYFAHAARHRWYSQIGM